MDRIYSMNSPERLISFDPDVSIHLKLLTLVYEQYSH